MGQELSTFKTLLNYLFPFLINIVFTGIILFLTFFGLIVLGIFISFQNNLKKSLDNEVLTGVLIVEIIIAIIFILFTLKRNYKIFKEQCRNHDNEVKKVKILYIIQFLMISISTSIILFGLYILFDNK